MSYGTDDFPSRSSNRVQKVRSVIQLFLEKTNEYQIYFKLINLFWHLKIAAQDWIGPDTRMHMRMHTQSERHVGCGQELRVPDDLGSARKDMSRSQPSNKAPGYFPEQWFPTLFGVMAYFYNNLQFSTPPNDRHVRSYFLYNIYIYVF